MDVISLGKAKKAAKHLKEVQDRLGMNGTEQGMDIRDTYETVDARVSAIEENDPKAGFYNRISEVASHTAINLNKHNLRVASLLNQSRYKLENMIVDDFQDDVGIDYNKSINIVYKNGSVMSKEEGLSELVLKEEHIDAIAVFYLSALYSNAGKVIKEIDLTKGMFNNLVIEDQSISIKKKDNGFYYATGTYESDVVELGVDVKEVTDMVLTSDLPEGTSINVQYAFSHDGKAFGPYRDDASTVGNYVKIKIHFYASIASAEVQLPISIKEGHIVFEGNMYKLSHLGSAQKPILIQNIEKYKKFQYDESDIENKQAYVGRKIFRLVRKIDKGWNR